MGDEVSRAHRGLCGNFIELRPSAMTLTSAQGAAGRGPA